MINKKVNIAETMNTCSFSFLLSESLRHKEVYRAMIIKMYPWSCNFYYLTCLIIMPENKPKGIQLYRSNIFIYTGISLI